LASDATVSFQRRFVLAAPKKLGAKFLVQTASCRLRNASRTSKTGH
jgi:hypothetical protein